ncbi:MAG: O-antigen polymerase [Candidatus Woesebacteria bacterium GW2011_GWA2_40_7]|uniref:O-antigen polymerase n=1 Tax=Candidatus Woesebacteria bacterium GW2011_GWA2_40_7 TaxID=1618562 RepID=A0A0G0VQL9_9BACT|nr:MAG: O-antigen polymerase [Candidatus Woesebacteria bacterium GW2011_GWA2_40_7]
MGIARIEIQKIFCFFQNRLPFSCVAFDFSDFQFFRGPSGGIVFGRKLQTPRGNFFSCPLAYRGNKLYLGHPLGTIGEANAVAGYLAIGSYFVFESFPKLLLLIPVLAIFFAQSRSGILAVVPLLARIKKSFLIILIPVAVLSLYIFTVGKGISPFENRQIIWKLGIGQILQRPLLGYGAESGEVVFDNAFIKSGFPLSDLTVDRAHNLFLDVAMWTGILGLILFLGFLYQAFIRLEINKKIAFLSFLIYSMFQPLSIVHWILLIIIINI